MLFWGILYPIANAAIMNAIHFKYIYGPVSSWRLGSSLGVDIISTKEKTCTFNCIYCQLGRAVNLTRERKIYVSTEDIIKEIKSLPSLEIDYVTFSGRGESTLAKNLGQVINSIRKIRHEKIAVLTNSTLIDIAEVRKALSFADLVISKLDAFSQESLELINKPMPGIKFDTIVRGLKQFRTEYKGMLALQIMFIKENKDRAEELADLAREIGPDKVDINTPLRPCGVKPLSKEELLKIKEYFKDLNPICVYEAHGKDVSPISREDTLKRRGKIT